MTDDECIALALLHAPSTRKDITGVDVAEIPATDPLKKSDELGWWVYRDIICAPDFDTAGEAARHYCKHYGLL